MTATRRPQVRVVTVSWNSDGRNPPPLCMSCLEVTPAHDRMVLVVQGEALATHHRCSARARAMIRAELTDEHEEE